MAHLKIATDVCMHTPGMIKEDATFSWYAFRFRTFSIPKDAFNI